MTALIDNLSVGLLLLASIGYAVMALGPQSWRRRIRRALGFKAPVAKSTGSCGGCEGCASESAAPEASAEIKIPVGKIGRR